jgi:hypothetical protein
MYLPRKYGYNKHSFHVESLILFQCTTYRISVYTFIETGKSNRAKPVMTTFQFICEHNLDD